MPTTLAVNEVDFKGYNLSVTTRDAGDDPAVLEELTLRTMSAWLRIAEQLEKQDYVAKFAGSVEDRYCAEQTMKQDTDAPDAPAFKLVEKWGDPRVTVWNTYRSEKKLLKFHLNSDDETQVAIDTWLAQNKAITRLKESLAKLAPQSAQDAPAPAPAQQTAERPATPKNAPVAPPQAVEGAIVATRAPNSKRPDYANGQLVSFTVTKIVASSNKGSAVYQMWTPLGSQYPTITVYKFKPNSQDLKPDYEAIIPILNKLNLSLDKPEAMGTWRLICRAAHVPNKETNADLEYLNVVSLTAI